MGSYNVKEVKFCIGMECIAQDKDGMMFIGNIDYVTENLLLYQEAILTLDCITDHMIFSVGDVVSIPEYDSIRDKVLTKVLLIV
jgi:hypothetical protein